MQNGIGYGQWNTNLYAIYRINGSQIELICENDDNGQYMEDAAARRYAKAVAEAEGEPFIGEIRPGDQIGLRPSQLEVA